MSNIKIVNNPSDQELEQRGVRGWSIWTKEVSEFPWTYSGTETCYFLEGEVEVVTDDGESVKVGKGDLVTFPDGLSCTWKVTQPVRKHYIFE